MIEERQLIHFRGCSCVYHMLDPILISPCHIRCIIRNIVGGPGIVVRRVKNTIIQYFKHCVEPDAFLLNFLLSTYMVDNKTRGDFVQEVWRVLLQLQSFHKHVEGGFYCKLHGRKAVRKLRKSKKKQRERKRAQRERKRAQREMKRRHE